MFLLGVLFVAVGIILLIMLLFERGNGIVTYTKDDIIMAIKIATLSICLILSGIIILVWYRLNNLADLILKIP